MEDFISRLIDERKELANKCDLLEGFFGTNKFAGLSVAHQIMLRKQLDAMGEYHSILTVRLALLEHDK